MLIGIVLFAFMRALGELLLSNSKFNSFVDIANEYLGPFGGFVGWTYWVCWIVSSMSSHCDGTICLLVPQVPHWLTVLFIVLILISFNLLGARLFGELEFWFSIIKVVTIIMVCRFSSDFLSFKTEYGHASFGNLIHHGGVSTWCSWIFNVLPNCCIFIYRYRTYRVTAGETKNPEKQF